MSNFKLDNPVLIDRMKVTETMNEKPQISLYHGALKHPVLNLPPFSYGLLFDVGFDPNTMEPGKTYHTRFWARWEASEKNNTNGNAYKNVTELIPGNNDTLLHEVQAIKALLAYLAEQQPGGREALVAWYMGRGGEAQNAATPTSGN